MFSVRFQNFLFRGGQPSCAMWSRLHVCRFRHPRERGHGEVHYAGGDGHSSRAASNISSMNPSDIETSDSTSSSSLASSSLRDSADAVGSTTTPTHNDDDEACGAIERARGASIPPPRTRGKNGGGETGQENARVHGSKRDTPGKSGACDGSDSMRRTIKSPARSHNGRNSGRARTNHAGDQNGVAQPSTGTKGTSSRQRPVSAPSKVYPFARHQELPSKEDGEEVEDSGRPTVGARARTHESRRPYADPATGGREAVKKRRDDTGNERCGRVRESESSAGRQRLSMSSIFGVASERRTSDERQTATKHPLLLDERGKVARRGVMGSGLQEGSNEEGETPNAPLSSQEFGLHRWKEYAVLRHGRNRRFVNSPHGREILQETASKIRAKEVEDLNRELTEMRALVEELYSALRAEQTEKSGLQARVIVLEREVEGMDFARRRWLREDASNRGRGSNLERRLAGNTGNLRTFLFGASAKPETTRSTTPEEPYRSSASRSRSPVGASRTMGGCGGIGGTATSERSSDGEEDLGGAEGNAAVVERNAVRRARETAELERSELRRRHDVEMSAKQSRIEKLKLEIRKVEAERDGLKQAAESQAKLFKDGYAELRACLKEMRTQTPALPSTAYGPGISSFEAPARQAEERSWRASGERQEAAANGESKQAWVQAMLATEDVLNHQVRTLQSLLLEAVSAAAPVVPLPAAVTKAADAFRERMGLPPPGCSRSPPSPSHDVRHSSSSRHPGAADASAGRRPGDLRPTGHGRSHEAGRLERNCITGERLELSSHGEPSRTPRSRHRHQTTPSAGQPVAGAMARPEVESGANTGTIPARNAAETSEGSPIRLTPTRGSRGDEDCRSCTGSEGSGTAWVRVLPTDETSSEEDFVSPPSPKSHPEEKTRGSRWRGRDEILRWYLGGVGGGDEGLDDGPNAAGESRRRAWSAMDQTGGTAQHGGPS